ncbi:MAG: hypothetical protein ACREYC_18315 [Gammaproteobacteria bacterium]
MSWLNNERAAAPLGAKLEDLRKRSEIAWEDLKDGTERAWAEYGKAIENFLSHFK